MYQVAAAVSLLSATFVQVPLAIRRDDDRHAKVA